MADECILEGGHPLVWTRYEGDPSLDSFKRHLDELDGHVRRRMEPYALLLESRLTGFSAGHRKACVEYMQGNEDLNELIVGIGMVLHSSFQRGIVTALLWFYSAPYEMKVFKDRTSAERWAMGLFVEDGA